MNKPSTSLWLWLDADCNDVFLTDPTARGFKQTDCGPDALENDAHEFAERIGKVAVRVSTLDGGYTKRLTPAGAAAFIRSEFGRNGQAHDGYVSTDGVARLSGVQFCKVGSKIWYETNPAQLLAAFPL